MTTINEEEICDGGCNKPLLICDSGMKLCSVGCKDKWVKLNEKPCDGCGICWDCKDRKWGDRQILERKEEEYEVQDWNSWVKMNIVE